MGQDAVERASCEADFQIVIYPGPLGIPDQVSTNAPPAFFLVANDDTSHARPVLKLIQEYQAAKRPVEAHLYAQGGHGFNMGNRSKLKTINTWPQRMADWMADSGLLMQR